MSELVTVAAPDGAVRAVRGVTGREYTSTDGMYRMAPTDARALLAEGGFRPSLASPTRGGYRCSCGFRPVVRQCSRCGGTAYR